MLKYFIAIKVASKIFNKLYSLFYAFYEQINKKIIIQEKNLSLKSVFISTKVSFY